MPLPDERPRQSVANLIGRFENKRLSIPASSPSRSCSVVSHVTGDSVKEEVKDKREWPPKSVASIEKPPLVIPTSFRYIPPSQSQPLSNSSPSTPVASKNSQVKQGEPLSQIEPDVPLTTSALQRQIAEAPSSFLENWRKDVPLVAAEMAPEPESTSLELTLEALTPSLPTPTASMKKLGNSIPPRTPTAALKTSTNSSSAAFKATPAIPKVPTKAMTKSPAPRSSTAQPLRTQHTGQSAVSATPTRKSTVKPAPVTQKNGSRSDASRAKTPTSTRSKTPSTGLFAPTAASLARSRNPLPQLPTPTKKSSLSGSSMDRLSKPTAASLSKARPPAVAATSKSRPTIAKTKGAPTTPKDKSIAQEPATHTVVSLDQIGSGVIPAAMEDNVKEAKASSVSYTAEGVILSNEGALLEDADPTLVSSLPAPKEETVVEAKASSVSYTAEGVVLSNEGALSEDADPTLVSSLPAPKEETVVEDIQEDSTSGVSASEPVSNHLGEHKPTDDLQDIVNLLESVPPTKSESAMIPDMPDDMPDDILEIPDEEERRQ